MTRRARTPRPAPTEADRDLARRAQRVAVVMVVAIVAWMALQWVGGAMGLPAALVFALDLAALGAFVWALAATYGLWRRRQAMRE